MKQVLVIAIAVCFFASCDNGKKVISSKKAWANPSELSGTWQLNYLSGPNPGFDWLYPDKKPIIVFDIVSSRVSGNTGCNSFSGPVIIDGSKISFTQPLVTTKMFCPGEGEALFMDALKKINLWAITDASTLNLIMGNTPVMRFTRIR